MSVIMMLMNRAKLFGAMCGIAPFRTLVSPQLEMQFLTQNPDAKFSSSFSYWGTVPLSHTALTWPILEATRAFESLLTGKPTSFCQTA